MNTIFRGVKPLDWALTGILSGLGVLIMLFDIRQSDAAAARAVSQGSMVHTLSSHSVWMLPVFLGAIVPLLWWRRSVLAVAGGAVVVMGLHDVLFGWVTRCGVALPVAFVLTFLGALTYQLGRAWLAAGLASLLSLVSVVRDASTGPGALVLALPVILIVFGIARVARHRATMTEELKIRDEELRRMRDERAALAVGDDRARLSLQLDELLRDRLHQLSTAAESAPGLPPAEAQALLESIEASSRETLEDMREIVGLLRGGEVTMAPTPTVAHLDALLARHQAGGSRLAVTGNPRSLPATIELSAYRIVEHLLTALGDRAGSPVDVAVRFGENALEIRVSGPIGHGSEVKAALARAKERAKLLGGSVEVKMAQGRTGAVAQLPVPSLP